MVEPTKRVEYLAGLLKGISKFSESLGADEGKGYAERFAAFKGVGVDGATTVASNPINAPKNRYRNILAFDDNRVHLDSLAAGGNDYINASWIDCFQTKRRYIATQGPVPATIPDFWAMIWQYNVSVVVKVTREVENQKLKCHRYWPDPDSEPPQKFVLIAQIEVEHLSTTLRGQWLTRQFKLRKGSEERQLTQLSYEAWPDHGVPLTARDFLDFRKDIKLAEASSKGPVIVHCSAGVGRTGTYIVVDRILECVEKGIKSADLDLDRAIQSMREQRPSMVQSEAQYKFCYASVLAGIRQELTKYEAAKVTPEVKKYIVDDRAAAKEAEKKEDEDIAEIVKRRVANINPTSFTELESTQRKWQKGERYAAEYEMSDLESRFVSLAMTGAELDLTPAMPDQIRDLVYKAKALDERKLREHAESVAKEAEEAEKSRNAAASAAKKAEKNASKSAAQSKASKFLRKRSSGN